MESFQHHTTVNNHQRELVYAFCSIIFGIFLFFAISNDVIHDLRGEGRYAQTAPWWFLYTFTCQSNIFVLIYLVLFVIGVFGYKKYTKLYHFTHSTALVTSVTLYISITFFVVIFILNSVIKGEYDETADYFIVHNLSPVYMWLIYFFVKTEGKYDWKKLLYTLIYPLTYVVLTAIVGGLVEIYDTETMKNVWAFPYAFLNYKNGVGIYFAYVFGLLLIFSLFGYGLGKLKPKIDRLFVERK